ncbi:MAG: hypothetical protein HYS98_06160 [Deltaproteobacteria bacterium]|nr:hypothetical protein [Deltaproteobacteria bacterium]
MNEFLKTSILLFIFSVFVCAEVPKKISSSKIVFQSPTTLIHLEEIPASYFSLQEKIKYYLALKSLDPQEQKESHVMIKNILMGLLSEELFLFEGENLVNDLKGKVQNRAQFIYGKSRKKDTWPVRMTDIQTERLRVKNVVYSYFLRSLSAQLLFLHAPFKPKFLEKEYEDRFKKACQEAFVEAYEGLPQKLSQFHESKLMEAVMNDNESGSLYERIQRHKELFEKASINLEKLLDPMCLSLKINQSLFVRCFYNLLKDVEDPFEWESKAQSLVLVFNKIFQKIVSLREIPLCVFIQTVKLESQLRALADGHSIEEHEQNLRDRLGLLYQNIVTVDILNNFNPRIHGAFVFPENEEDKKWLLWMSDLKEPAYYLLKVARESEPTVYQFNTLLDSGETVAQLIQKHLANEKLVKEFLNYKTKLTQDFFDFHLERLKSKDPQKVIDSFVPDKDFSFSLEEFISFFLK